MGFDIYSIVLSLVMLLVGYYVIRRLPHLLTIVVTGLVLSFVLIFVTRDMLHLPINDYVDTTAWDDVTNQAKDYSDEKFTGRAEFERSLGVEEVVSDEDVEDEVGKIGSIVPEGVYMYAYEDYDTEAREELLLKYEGVIDDESFKNKLLGMNPYVDVKFELGNAELYNSKDGKHFVIEFDK